MTVDDTSIPDFLRRTKGDLLLSGPIPEVRGRQAEEAHRADGPGTVSARYLRRYLPAEEAEALVASEAAAVNAALASDRTRRIDEMKVRIERLRELRGGGPHRAQPRRPQREEKISRGRDEEKKKMATDTKKKEPVNRDVSRPAGKVGDFKTVRSGTARATVVEMAGKGSGAHVDDIAKAIESDAKTVMTHLYCMSRDCAFGYDVKNGKASMVFPGSKTWKDAIGAPAAEKKAA